MPVPTVSRIVLYVMPDGSPSYGQVRPAIITRVNQGEMLNLSVQLDGPNDGDVGDSNTLWRGSVAHNQDDKLPGTWHWMDFQLQSAPVSDPAKPTVSVAEANPAEPQA